MAVWCTTLPVAMHHLCGSSAPFRRWRCTIIRGQAALLGRHMQKFISNKQKSSPAASRPASGCLINEQSFSSADKEKVSSLSQARPRRRFSSGFPERGYNQFFRKHVNSRKTLKESGRKKGTLYRRILAPDDEEQEPYILPVQGPVNGFTEPVIAVILGLTIQRINGQ